ncbi:MAG: hypothetical protein WA807_01110 [Steroidobacteraceae bacterium]
MKFRLRAFGLHLLASVFVLSLMLGTLYLGWYHWPGWYLADASHVVVVLAGVDVVIGPALTLIIANANKPRGELRRDLSIIVALQLIALGYGTTQLWNGRPLYYAFSESVLQMIQAYDIDPGELKIARAQNAPLVPHWHSLPRWIWAPLPEDPTERTKILSSAVQGGLDVISMPRYYKPWDQGLAALRTQLKNVDDIGYFGATQKQLLKQRMRDRGLATDQRDAIPLIGRGPPLLAVVDPLSLRIKAIIKSM